MSKWQAHKTFKVARTTIDSWLKRWEETGSLSAKTSYYRGRPPELEDTPEVHGFIEKHREKTQQQKLAQLHADLRKSQEDITAGRLAPPKKAKRWLRRSSSVKGRCGQNASKLLVSGPLHHVRRRGGLV
jgi:hypothetical protein